VLSRALPPNHRLFFALWPDDELQAVIEREACELVARSGGKPVPRTHYHATLAFLGSVAAERLAVVRAVAAEITAPEFVLQLDHIHGWRRSGILFMGTHRVPAALTQLVDALQSKLREREFVLEERPFRLHVTLARNARLTESVPVAQIDWQVNEFALVESTPGRGGSRYEVIGRWALGADR